MDGSSMVDRKHPIQKKATMLYLTVGKILIDEGKNRPFNWAKLHADFLAVMEELDNNSPNVWVYIDFWIVTNGLACGQADEQWRTGLLKACLYVHSPNLNQYGSLRDILK